MLEFSSSPAAADKAETACDWQVNHAAFDDREQRGFVGRRVEQANIEDVTNADAINLGQWTSRRAGRVFNRSLDRRYDCGFLGRCRNEGNKKKRSKEGDYCWFFHKLGDADKHRLLGNRQ